ncbi:MAG TPA: hypothetical protein VIL48_21175 [Acidimicrobiales bacterium]
MAQASPTHRPTHRRTRRRAALALIAGLALIGAACGDDDGGSGTASGDGDAMTVSISDPADGATVGRTFDVALDSSVPLGEPETGRHHVHLYYDGNTAEGEYDIVYGTSATVDALDPGEHTIEAVIANPDHSVTDVRDEITVTVGEDEGGDSGTGTDGSDGTDSPSTTTDMGDGGSTGYGY